MGRINGLGVYEPASANPFPIVHKKKSSSMGPSLPSIHWSELPMPTIVQPPSKAKFFSRPELKKQSSPPKRMQQSLKKMGIEVSVDHATGHPKPKFSRPLLQTTTLVPSFPPTVAPSVKGATNQPTAMPTTNMTWVPYPGPINSGYAAYYAQYDPTDPKCTSSPTYAFLYSLGTCIANGDGTALMYTSDVS